MQHFLHNCSFITVTLSFSAISCNSSFISHIFISLYILQCHSISHNMTFQHVKLWNCFLTFIYSRSEIMIQRCQCMCLTSREHSHFVLKCVFSKALGSLYFSSGVEGKAGMAAIADVMNDFNCEMFLRDVQNALPSYTRPVFLRLSPEVDKTGDRNRFMINFPLYFPLFTSNMHCKKYPKFNDKGW